MVCPGTAKFFLALGGVFILGGLVGFTLNQMIDSIPDLTVSSLRSNVDERTVKIPSDHPADVEPSSSEQLLLRPIDRIRLACMEIDKSMPLLTSFIKRVPEVVGMVPWIEGNYQFPGLDQQLINKVYRGRKMVILGDSTTIYLHGWLWSVLTCDEEDCTKGLSYLSVKEARRRIIPTKKDWESQSKPKVLNLGDGTIIKRFGGGSIKCDVSQEELRLAKQAVKNMRPDIFLVNNGLHILHFAAAGRDPETCAVNDWIHYEDFLEEMVSLAESSGVKVLVFKTTNYVCTKKFYGAYIKANERYQNKTEELLNSCAKVAQELSPVQHTEEELRWYCDRGVFNDEGASYLNERVGKFVSKRSQTSSVKLVIMNDHDLQSCPYTKRGDGRHYRALNPMRLRLLTNLLNCAFLDTDNKLTPETE